MDTHPRSIANLEFFSAAGKKGQLTQLVDWSRTPIGAPETWPQSLRPTLNIISHSKYPMLLLWGKDLVCIHNDAYQKRFDQNGMQTSILGMRAAAVWPEHWSQIHPVIEHVMRTGEATATEEPSIFHLGNVGRTDNGVTCHCSPVYDESDSIHGVLVTFDETAQQPASATIASSEESRFRNVANYAPAMIWMSDAEKHCHFFNAAWLDFTGRTLEQEQGDGWIASVHPDDLKSVTAICKTAYEHCEEYYVEYRLRRHDGQYRWISEKAAPHHAANGDFEGFIGACIDIHEKVVAAQQMNQAEEKLNVIIEASELGTWELNVKTNEVTYSDRFLDTFAFPEGAKPHHSDFIDRIHRDDLPQRKKAFETAFKTGILHYESRIYWPDNSIHWFEARGKVFFDADGAPENAIGTIRDITSEKLHEAELIRSETKFRLLADSMPQHIWTANPEGVLDYFNASVYSFSGHTPDSLAKVGWIDIVHPDDREENAKVWLAAVKNGTPFIFEHRFRRHDGEYRWQLSRAIPQRDAYGQIQMWVGTSTDIQDQKMFTTELETQVRKRTNELKKLNETLAKSEQRYHLMVEEVQDYAILYLNEQGIVENWNKGAEKIKGYSAEEIIGRNFSNFYTEEDKNVNLPQHLLATARKTGKANQEGWRVRKDGTKFWASVTITAVHNPEGKVIGFSKVTHDLTEKREVTEQLKNNAAQLQQKNAELEKMNKELESFAYISSHDLQEPLRKIQTFASRIQDVEYENLSDNAKDNFSRMQSAAKRMQVLIEDLLVYSRTSDTERKYVKTDLNKLINEVVDDMGEELLPKNATIQVDGLGKADVIPFQFRQLMQNLFSNSFKFSKDGVAPVITISGETHLAGHYNIDKLRDGVEYCHIRVSDNGIGFDPNYSEKIFEVFQRLHGKAEYVGTGIGLAIVKKIVDNLNGVITATGKLGVGATFDIYFPVSAKSIK